MLMPDCTCSPAREDFGGKPKRVEWQLYQMLCACLKTLAPNLVSSEALCLLKANRGPSGPAPKQGW